MAAWRSQHLSLCSSRKMNTSKCPLRLSGSQRCYRTRIYTSHSVALGLLTRGLCCPLRTFLPWPWQRRGAVLGGRGVPAGPGAAVFVHL